MTSLTIPGRNGYDIPCLHSIRGDEQMVCVLSHGMGSSKNGATAQRMMAYMPRFDIPIIAYDFPGHGESPVDGAALRLDNCMNDLAAVETYARTLAPQAEIVYFGSSFGAYVTLVYLSTRPSAGRRAFLRSAAVEMPQLLQGYADAHAQELQEKGYVLLDMDYPHPIQITQGLLDDLARNNVFDLYQPGMAELFFIHGEADQVASYEAVCRFAQKKGAMLRTLPGGGHDLSGPGEAEDMQASAAAFYLRDLQSFLLSET